MLCCKQLFMKALALFFAVQFCVVFGWTQTLDPNLSTINFEVSNFKFNTVEGSLSKLSGTVIFNPATPQKARFSVCIPVNTIKTGIEKRDEHLLTADFFDAENHPTICFESTKVEALESGYKATGTLTVRGVSKPIEILFTVAKNMLIGDFSLNRFNYNIGADTGTLTVGSEVKVHIVCVVN